MPPFFSIAFPAIDPVLFELGPLAVRWYSLSYIAGILLGWFYISRLNNELKILDTKAFDDLIIWVIIGIILGGRVGYVVFYSPSYYMENPGDIIKLWQGGMAFHGGMLGVIVAMYLFSKVKKIEFLGATDLLAVAAPIGLMLGRIANFINGELYGRVSDVSWAMVFPTGGEEARHPSQLYQAFLEGFCLLIIMFVLYKFTKIKNRRGLLSAAFLIGYSVFRSFAEFFREPDAQLGLIISPATMGQILCIPMFAVGIYLILRAKKQK